MNSKRLILLSISLLLLISAFSCGKKATEPGMERVSTPTFDPPGGTYSGDQNVSILCATLGVTIFYTTDGTEPHSGSSIYKDPIEIFKHTTIKAKAFRNGFKDSKTAKATYTIELLPMEMVLVPGGTFTMGRTTGSGDGDELPTHSVILSSFYIGKYEVTQVQYANLMQPISSWTSEYGLLDNYPAYDISWYDAIKYCNLRSMAEGFTPVYSISGSTDPVAWGSVPNYDNSTWNDAICNWDADGYRLPTEAEWEYAARGATNTPDYLYSGSDDINEVAWYDANSGDKAHPVGSKAANGIGTYDMSGNLWEWCWDWYGSYSSSPQNNPKGPTSGSYRLLRGGVWDGNATYCRVAYRYNTYPYHSYSSGFRLCRAIR